MNSRSRAGYSPWVCRMGSQRVERGRVTNAFMFEVICRPVHVAADGPVSPFFVAE